MADFICYDVLRNKHLFFATHRKTRRKMMQKENTTPRPFGMRDKLSYAAGDCACNFSFALKSYLFLFYTQFIGLPVTVWSIIILIAQIWDAINDPIVGSLVDAIKPGKRGKYNSWIFYGSIILLVSGAGLFIPIPNAPMWVKIVVASLGYFLWDLSYTMVNVPYGTMAGVITSDSTERAELSTWRTIGSMVPNFLLMVLIPIIVYDENNKLLGDRVFFVALIFGVLAFFLFQWMMKTTVIRVEMPDTTKQAKKKFNYGRAIAHFFKNRSIVGVTLAGMVMFIVFNGMTAANAVLVQSYFKASQISGLMNMITVIPYVICIFITKPLVKKFGKQDASAYPILLGVVGAIVMLVYDPPMNITGYIIWQCLVFLVSLGYSVFSFTTWAMVADAIDYNEWKTGERDEGTTYGIFTFGRKLAQGIGASAIGLLLIAVGYVESTAEVQTVEVAHNIKNLVAGLYLGGMVLMFLCLKFMYNIDKKTVAEMEAALGRNSDQLIGETGEDLDDETREELNF